jgi:hypothetical protein
LALRRGAAPTRRTPRRRRGKTTSTRIPKGRWEREWERRGMGTRRLSLTSRAVTAQCTALSWTVRITRRAQIAAWLLITQDSGPSSGRQIKRQVPDDG